MYACVPPYDNTVQVIRHPTLWLMIVVVMMHHCAFKPYQQYTLPACCATSICHAYDTSTEHDVPQVS